METELSKEWEIVEAYVHLKNIEYAYQFRLMNSDNAKKLLRILNKGYLNKLLSGSLSK